MPSKWRIGLVPLAIAATLSLVAGSAGAGGPTIQNRSFKPAAPTAAQIVAAQGAQRVTAAQGNWRGRSWAEWAIEQSRWLYSIPFNVNPLVAGDGSQCMLNQTGSVWFVAASGWPPGQQPAPWNCTIPQGTALFGPVFAFVNDYPCPDPSFEPAPGQSLEQFLAAFVAGLVDVIQSPQAELNGKPITVRRIATRNFSFTGALSLAGFDACVTGSPQIGVADGYYWAVDPLPVGDHVITVRSDASALGWGPLQATYNIRVR